MLSKGLVNKDGWIHIRKTVKGRRIQQSTGIPYERGFFPIANQVLRDLETDIYTGAGKAGQPRRCSEGGTRYLEGCKEKSLKRAASGLDNVLTFRLEDGRLIKDIYLHDIRYWMIEQFIKSTSNRWAKGVATDLRPFKQMLTHAATIWHDDNGETWIDKAPTLPTPEGPAKKKVVLSEEQERAFISGLPRSLQPMALFGIHAGCRVSEIQGVKWSQYREKDGIAYFSLPASMTKMKRERPVVLNKSARGIVENQRGGEYVFDCRHLHTRAWNKAWEGAGLPMGEDYRKGTHTLRYTFASRLLDAGVPESTLQNAIGHKTRNILSLYAFPTLQAILEAVEAPYLVRNWCDRPRTFLTH